MRIQATILALAVAFCLPCASLAQTEATDCAALELIYANSAKPLPWPKSSCCGAQTRVVGGNIQCVAGRVTFVGLGGQGLVGSLPKELAGLDRLQFLNLEGNAFTGNIDGAIPKGVTTCLLTYDGTNKDIYTCAGDVPATCMNYKQVIPRPTPCPAVVTTAPVVATASPTPSSEPQAGVVTAPAPVPAAGTASTATGDSTRGTGAGSIAGSVVGAFLVVAALAGVAVYVRRRRTKKAYLKRPRFVFAGKLGKSKSTSSTSSRAHLPVASAPYTDGDLDVEEDVDVGVERTPEEITTPELLVVLDTPNMVVKREEEV